MDESARMGKRGSSGSCQKKMIRYALEWAKFQIPLSVRTMGHTQTSGKFIAENCSTQEKPELPRRWGSGFQPKFTGTNRLRSRIQPQSLPVQIPLAAPVDHTHFLGTNDGHLAVLSVRSSFNLLHWFNHGAVIASILSEGLLKSIAQHLTG